VKAPTASFRLSVPPTAKAAGFRSARGGVRVRG
jgi:hypothetical protein